MPIEVFCGACKTRFSVNEKFAGKKGPCPKCKAPITIPDQPAAAVEVHAPEDYGGGGAKDTKGRAVGKPIARAESKISPMIIGAVVVFTLLAFGGAFGLRGVLAQFKIPIVAVGLLLIGAPVAVAGYSFLREEELEPHRGKSLWIRALVCGTIYAALWGGYAWLTFELIRRGVISSSGWELVFVAPIFILLGAGAGFICFDLDFMSGAMLYLFYVLVCMALRFALGLPALWAAESLKV